MVRITKVYTKQGDAGQTRLAGGERLPKDHPRIEAYGTVDELSSQIGVAVVMGSPDPVHPVDPVDPAGPAESGRAGARTRTILTTVQNDLFHLGSSLAFLPGDDGEIPGPSLAERHVRALEEWIDEINGELPPLESFVLPGGTAVAAQLHVARCVCRRAERRVLRMGREEGREGAVPAQAIVYLNRLSDLLFVLARAENARAGVEEPLWSSRA